MNTGHLNTGQLKVYFSDVSFIQMFIIQIPQCMSHAADACYNPIFCFSSIAPSKEIEAKAFNQMYTDEKVRADKLQNEVVLLAKEVEGHKREWQEARSELFIKFLVS